MNSLKAFNHTRAPSTLDWHKKENEESQTKKVVGKNNTENVHPFPCLPHHRRNNERYLSCSLSPLHQCDKT